MRSWPRSSFAAALLAAAAASIIGWGASARSADHTVEVADDLYSPAQVVVAVGDTVVWNNTGAHTHTVTATDFNSGVMAPTATFRHTFTKAETVEYLCAFHDNMVGRVVVSSGSATATTAKPGSVTTTTGAGKGAARTTSTSTPAVGSATANGSTTTTEATAVGTDSSTPGAAPGSRDAGEQASAPTRHSTSSDDAPAPLKAAAALSLAGVSAGLVRQRLSGSKSRG